MNPKVVIVDDDDVNNFLCKKILSITNFTDDISVFINADSALAFIRDNISHPQNLPDLIFLDINMPVKNGWDFMKEYNSLKKDIKKNIKIYMLSSSVYEEDITKAKDTESIIDYIAKPLSKQILQKIAV